MGSALLILGIAALLVFGFVVLLTALTVDAPVKPGRARALAREPRPQRRQWGKQGKHELSARVSAVRELAVTSCTRAVELVDEWWPRLRHHARHGRARWLTLDSTSGQLIAATAAAVLVAYVIVVVG